MDSSSKPGQNSELDSLEGSSTVIQPQGAAGSPSPTPPSPVIDSGAISNAPKTPLFRRLLKSINIYFLLFVLVIIIAIAAIVVSYLYNKSTTDNAKVTTSQSLSQSTLDQLANSDVTVGDAKQTLSVQSNAVFAGKVLVRDTLEVAGGLQVGGSLTLTGIKVAGTSIFDTVQVTKDLAVSGNSSVQGQLNVQKSLNVNGSGTFNGPLAAPQLTVGSLQLSGDLNLTHHITGGGQTPSRSNGAALGSGGTVSISGSDTAGTITINTGSNPPAGCFVTVNFTSKFNATPHIIVTPVGAGAAGLAYYINRSVSSLSVCTASTPPSNDTFGFDYIAFD